MTEDIPARRQLTEEELNAAVDKAVLTDAEPQIHPDDVNPLLKVTDLEVQFRSSTGMVPAVRGANLTIYPGQTVAIVGESGSGKSTTAAAIIGLLPGTGEVTGGSIEFDGREISKLSNKEWVELRGSQIAMVPQDPMTNLNPVHRIGKQVAETLEANNVVPKSETGKRVAELLEEAGLPYTIIGLGGMLYVPEVADVRALLTAASDPERGDRVVRLLTGFGIGARDLRVLASLARELTRPATESGQEGPGVHGDHAEADSPLLSEALDTLLRWHEDGAREEQEEFAVVRDLTEAGRAVALRTALSLIHI